MEGYETTGYFTLTGDSAAKRHQTVLYFKGLDARCLATLANCS